MSLLVMLFAHSPYNISVYSVMKDKKVRAIPSYGEREGMILSEADNSVTIDCYIPSIDNKSICGVAFYLPFNILKNQFASFSEHDRIAFDVKASSEVNNFKDKLRVLIKNTINPKLDNMFDNSNMKFQAVRIHSGDNYRIPLDNFKVETWWEDQYNIPYELARKDFSKVAVIEFHLNDVPVRLPGHYKLKVSKLEVIKNYINVSLIYRNLLFYWLIFGTFVTIHFFILQNKKLHRIEKKAYYEDNSQLLNKHGFSNSYVKYSENPGALYIVKITNWKVIENNFSTDIVNNIFHSTCDKIINVLGLSKIICARLTYDEVVLLVPDNKLSPSDEIYMLKMFQESGDTGSVSRIRLKVKIGVVYEDFLPIDPIDMLIKGYRAIDTILNTGDSIKYYDQSISEHAKHEEFIDKQLDLAIKNEAFHLAYMPVYSSEDERIVGAEALIRCDWPALKGYGPDSYIPIAEKYGMIRSIDFWVVEEAIKTLSAAQHELSNDFTLSINISSRELLDDVFVASFKAWLNKYQVAANKICLEITETFFVNIEDFSNDSIEELRSLGCCISLDDFGTGYTSFVHITNLSCDEIKIDRSFVNNVDDNVNESIIRSIISIAKTKGYSVVAEGVETKSQFDKLVDMGCELFQGYLISKPVSFQQVMALNKSWKMEDRKK